MALENLISVTFTEAELKQMDDAFTVIEGILKGKVVNLSPKQRQQHGRVKYEMEVWVGKAVGYAGSNPALVPTFIDQAELKADFTTHGQLNPRIDRLQTLLQGMLDTNLLLGSDLFTNLTAFYRSLREASKSNAPGASAIYKDLKQQFPGRPSSGNAPATEPGA